MISFFAGLYWGSAQSRWWRVAVVAVVMAVAATALGVRQASTTATLLQLGPLPTADILGIAAHALIENLAAGFIGYGLGRGFARWRRHRAPSVQA